MVSLRLIKYHPQADKRSKQVLYPICYVQQVVNRALTKMELLRQLEIRIARMAQMHWKVCSWHQGHIADILENRSKKNYGFHRTPSPPKTLVKPCTLVVSISPQLLGKASTPFPPQKLVIAKRINWIPIPKKHWWRQAHWLTPSPPKTLVKASTLVDSLSPQDIGESKHIGWLLLPPEHWWKQAHWMTPSPPKHWWRQAYWLTPYWWRQAHWLIPSPPKTLVKASTLVDSFSPRILVRASTLDDALSPKTLMKASTLIDSLPQTLVRSSMQKESMHTGCKERRLHWQCRICAVRVLLFLL